MGIRVAVGVPALDVAALSATMDAMDPSRTPCLMNCSRAVTSLTLLMRSCSSTWQGGGAVLYKIK